MGLYSETRMKHCTDYGIFILPNIPVRERKLESRKMNF